MKYILRLTTRQQVYSPGRCSENEWCWFEWRRPQFAAQSVADDASPERGGWRRRRRRRRCDMLPGSRPAPRAADSAHLRRSAAKPTDQRRRGGHAARATGRKCAVVTVRQVPAGAATRIIDHAGRRHSAAPRTGLGLGGAIRAIGR